MWACIACVGILASGIAATLVAQVVDGDLRTTTRNQFYIMITTATTSLVTLLVVIVKHVADAFREKRKDKREQRQREWDLADREEARRIAAKERKELKDEMLKNTAITVEASETNKGAIKEAVQTAKEVKETVATKEQLADLRAQFDSLKK